MRVAAEGELRKTSGSIKQILYVKQILTLTTVMLIQIIFIGGRMYERRTCLSGYLLLKSNRSALNQIIEIIKVIKGNRRYNRNGHLGL